MALNNDEIRVAANGRVSIAPKGTAVPEDLAPLAAAFVDVGAVSDDGATIARKVNQDGVNIWQSTAPARYLITGTEVTVAMALMQFNPVTLPLYFGGGEVVETTTGSGVFKFDIEGGGSLDERVLVIDAFDGTLQYRYVFSRVQVSDTDDLSLKRTEASGLGITFGVLAPSTGDIMGTVITNDPAFAA